MKKRYLLIPYLLYFERWRGLSVLLCLLSLALLFFAPPPGRDYRLVLQFSAGLGALIFILGFAMAHLAYITVGQTTIAVQLPLWRVKISLADIKETRLLTLDRAAPGKWDDSEIADQSALLLDLKRWPQPEPVLRFWLGRLVLADALILPVDDVISLKRAVDAGFDRLRNQQKT
jgi:hypothetical protein